MDSLLGVSTLRGTSWSVTFAASLALGAALTLVAEKLGAPQACLGLLFVPLAVIVAPAAWRQGWEFVKALHGRLAWWHWLWLLLFLSYLNFRPRTSQDIQETPVDSWAMYRLLLVGSVALILGARLALKQTPWLGSLFRGIPGVLAAYTVVCTASTLWSVYPTWTLYRSLEYGVDVALLVAILATVKSLECYGMLFDWTITLYFLLVSAIWLGVLIWPQEALHPAPGLIGVELTGILPAVASNGVGELAAVLAVVALVRLLARPVAGSLLARAVGTRKLMKIAAAAERTSALSAEVIDRRASLCGSQAFSSRRALYSGLLAVSLVTLFFSQARSAILGLLAGAVLLLLFARRLAPVAMALVAALPLLIAGVSEWLRQYFMRGQNPEVFATLSGRVDWWEIGWQEFLKTPLTGLGAYTARFEVLAKIGEADTSTIHNTYMEVLVGTSFWGLIPVVIALAATWWVLLRGLGRFPRYSQERRLTLEAVAILAVVSVRSLFTSHLVSHPSLSFLLVAGYAELLRRRAGHGRRENRSPSAR